MKLNGHTRGTMGQSLGIFSILLFLCTVGSSSRLTEWKDGRVNCCERQLCPVGAASVAELKISVFEYYFPRSLSSHVLSWLSIKR